MCLVYMGVNFLSLDTDDYNFFLFSFLPPCVFFPRCRCRGPPGQSASLIRPERESNDCCGEGNY